MVENKGLPDKEMVNQGLSDEQIPDIAIRAMRKHAYGDVKVEERDVAYLNAEGDAAVRKGFEEKKLSPEPEVPLTLGKIGRAFISPFLAPFRALGKSSPLGAKLGMGAGIYGLGGMLGYVAVGMTAGGAGIAMAAAAVIVAPVMVGVIALKGLYNVYNTIRNKADYHPLTGRTAYNKELPHVMSADEAIRNQRLTSDKQSLTTDYVRKRNLEVACRIYAEVGEETTGTEDKKVRRYCATGSEVAAAKAAEASAQRSAQHEGAGVGDAADEVTATHTGRLAHVGGWRVVEPKQVPEVASTVAAVADQAAKNVVEGGKAAGEVITHIINHMQ